jgi:hypothetical protein
MGLRDNERDDEFSDLGGELVKGMGQSVKPVCL